MSDNVGVRFLWQGEFELQPRLGRIFVLSHCRTKKPSTKHQAPEKYQISRHQTPNSATVADGAGEFLSLELDAWCSFGAWSVEFGACCLGSQLLKNWDAPLLQADS